MPTPRRFNYKGKLMTIRQIAAKVKIKPKTLSERLRSGRSVKEAILTCNRMNNSPVSYGLYNGNCPNSPDVWADAEAKKLPFIIGRFDFPSAFGKRGGPMRNKVMVRMADKVVAFWDGQSTGTEGVIEYARKLGNPVELISCGAALRKGLTMKLPPNPNEELL